MKGSIEELKGTYYRENPGEYDHRSNEGQLYPNSGLKLVAAIYLGGIVELERQGCQSRKVQGHVVSCPFPGHDVYDAEKEVALGEEVGWFAMTKDAEHGKQGVELRRIQKAPHESSNDARDRIGEKVKEAEGGPGFDDWTVKQQRKGKGKNQHDQKLHDAKSGHGEDRRPERSRP